MEKLFIKIIFIIQKNLPPFIGRILFRLWWRNVRTKAPTDLVKMIDFVISSPSFLTFSPYWLFLSRRNLEQVINEGLSSFKQTIARDYFMIVSWKRREYYENLFKKIQPNDLVPLVNILKKHEFLGQETSFSYNIFTSLLLQEVQSLSSAERYLTLTEPNIGSPATITNGGKPVTSDLLNSILDFDSIFKVLPENLIENVIEFGGGYGRNAYCNISLLPNLKRYIMVDIPPALFLSQSYLSQVFPNKKIFKFRPFKSFKEVEDEFSESEIVFLMPEQVALLPNASIDLAIAIDCLHEMDKRQVRSYFNEFERIATYLYFKCLRKTENQFFQWEEYPKKESWESIFNRPTLVPAQYFETLYKLHS